MQKMPLKNLVTWFGVSLVHQSEKDLSAATIPYLKKMIHGYNTCDIQVCRLHIWYGR
jgi:hypothetical protein